MERDTILFLQSTVVLAMDRRSSEELGLIKDGFDILRHLREPPKKQVEASTEFRHDVSTQVSGESNETGTNVKDTSINT
jgi:hypothetical protein